MSSDTLDGGAGADFLYGGADNDWLGYTATGLGNESQEEINSDGNFYEGGTGNDVACGSKNKDTYRFARGDGRDYVITQGGADELQLVSSAEAPVTEDDIHFVCKGLSLVVWLGTPDEPGSDSVEIQGWFNEVGSANQLGQITLALKNAEGALSTAKQWTAAQATDLALTKEGTAFDDALTALPAPNGFTTTVLGKEGNDVFRAGSGSVVFDGGAGVDTVDYSTTTVSLTLTPNSSGFQETGIGSHKLLNVENFIGGSGNDTFYGGAGSNRYEGGSGNDTLFGAAGNDTLIGGAGNDILVGGADIDVLIGGEGDDTYTIDTVGDTIIEDGTSSNDSVNAYVDYTLADGIEVGRAQGSCGRLTGNALANTLRDATAFATSTVFEGGDGNDTFYLNGGGNDVVRGGAGTDVLNLTFTGFTTPPTVTLPFGSSVLTFAGGSIAFDSIEQINFGVGADNIAIDGFANGLRVLYSGDASLANTTNVGHYRNGTGWFIGGSFGNENITLENLTGSAWDSRGGDDTYHIVGNAASVTIADYTWNSATNTFGNGGQDVVSFDSIQALSELSYRRLSDGSVEVRSIDGMYTKLYASNGMGAHHIEQLAAPRSGVALLVEEFFSAIDETAAIWGTTGNDTRVQGDSRNNNLYGRQGDDFIVGGEGADQYWFRLGDGHDRVQNKDAVEGDDVIRLDSSLRGHAISATRSDDALVLQVDTGDSLTVTDWFSGGSARVVLPDGSSVTAADINARFQEAVYDYTYQHIYARHDFALAVRNISDEFARAETLYTASAVSAVFDYGLGQAVATGLTHEGADVYRWGWKAGTLNDEALSQGATYGDIVTLTENNRTRSSASLLNMENVTSGAPVERTDLWYDFWNSPTEGWQFAITDAYSADATTAQFNPDGSITPSQEFNQQTWINDPAVWRMITPATNSFQLFGGLY